MEIAYIRVDGKVIEIPLAKATIKWVVVSLPAVKSRKPHIHSYHLSLGAASAEAAEPVRRKLDPQGTLRPHQVYRYVPEKKPIAPTVPKKRIKVRRP